MLQKLLWILFYCIICLMHTVVKLLEKPHTKLFLSVHGVVVADSVVQLPIGAAEQSGAAEVLFAQTIHPHVVVVDVCSVGKTYFRYNSWGKKTNQYQHSFS